MRITYLGPFEAVEVPALHRVVRRDESVEVDDELGAALVAQSCWAQAETPARPPKTKAKTEAPAEATTEQEAP
ncbi:hypothetical protein NLX83_39525 [Allokutzneria sp. A3M-2-11 16]|uniref:DUF7302 family protein n=1 Tax=Allokutzneria sp. A3M-2-11 16 TaxID=2962043 RepID=UPI0020B78831|nr:hypothetical protein [Allokutzneria sp. A3M-2-11 16]MCP3805375.1 hypothetical protein [Allokutzneria sp. A3M-2-11 16]